MDVKEVELTTLWGRVIEEVAANAPQHRAFLQLTKPLGLLHNDDQTTLLVAAPNLFAKDVLESRLRTVVSEVLTRELGATTNIAVTVDETLEVVATSGVGVATTSKVSSTVTAIFVVAPSSRVKTSLTTVRRRLSRTSFAKRLGAATNKVV